MIYNFPYDYGSHPSYIIEWWYVTGFLSDVNGFQITFFRYYDKVLKQNFIIGHVALSDILNQKLIYDQRLAIEDSAFVYARKGNTDIALNGWGIVRDDGLYKVNIVTQEFTYNLTLTPTQAIMLQENSVLSSSLGDNYYYSDAQLNVSGSLIRNDVVENVSGISWLDHEWSNGLLNSQSTGWDWISANLYDGGNLMCFRTRHINGSDILKHAVIHSSGLENKTKNVEFIPIRYWTSPHTNAKYPIEMQISIDGNDWVVQPIYDDQEFDSTQTTGIVYWEGAIRVLRDGEVVGRGYLEMTGYNSPFRL